MAINVIGRENRIMIKAIQGDIREIKTEMKNISNHYSKRLPAWASVLFMVLTAVIGGLIGRGLF